MISDFLAYHFRPLWIWFLARFRLNPGAVCEASRSCGYIDYHDYPDGIAGEPLRFHIHVCKRCGKKFVI